MVEYNNKLLCSNWSPPFNPAPFKSLKTFLRSQRGVGSHLVYKFDKQIARCNNSQEKILDLFEFPHVLAA